MQFKNSEAETQWHQGIAKNDDDYGRACFVYSSEWATRMEAEIAQGKKIADIADRTSHEADDEGITGFMYGIAVSILAGCWLHGEALRLWHNLNTQIGTEGEKANEAGTVLNPAILNIGNK